MEEKREIEDFTDEELKSELEIRGFNVFDDYELDERDKDILSEVVTEEAEEAAEGFFIKRDFLGYELRDHLLKITGQGGWVNDDLLLDTLKELIK